MEDGVIKLPVLGAKDKTVSGLVVTILTEEWPLSTKGLLNRLNRRYAKDVSIQAVHKAVKKLHSEDILLKIDAYYKLNPKWLREVGNFSSAMIGKYTENETMLKDLP